ncbi:hypothetical protein [Streptomyces sp. NPDC057293]|uniref:hypothetical protein n=1 Tax=unclassified Streptomyces TaxID=2593676 RepID=UPI003629DE1D
MARLQILELPTGADDDRPPFVLVVDQMPADEPGFEALRRDLTDGNLAERTGARAVLVFEDTIDIPANDTSGYLSAPGQSWVAMDDLRGQIQEEIAKAHAEVINTLNGSGPTTVDAQEEQASSKPRRDWCCSLAFQTLGKQHIDDCRQDGTQP